MNKDAILILRQRQQKQILQNEIRGIVYPVLVAWGDRNIDKRLATKVQEALDAKYGIEPPHEETLRHNPNARGYSRVSVSYTKENDWNNDPRYRLEVYAHNLVDALPVTTDSNGYTQQHRNDDRRIQMGTSFAHDMAELQQAFEPDPNYSASDYTMAIGDLEIVEAEYNKAIAAVKRYKQLVNMYGEARYTLHELIDERGEIKSIYI